MDIVAVSAAGTIALACTVVFLLVARIWHACSRSLDMGPNFAGSIMHEAAQRFRNELERLSTAQSHYLGGLLVFVLLFFAAYVLEARQIFSGYPEWQLYLQLAFLIMAAAFALIEIGRTIASRQRLRLRADANIAVGHQLQLISTEATRVFHDVKTSAGAIDHVVVGPTGIYAVNVVARRARSGDNVRLSGNCLTFSRSHVNRPITDLETRTTCLAEEFETLLGYKVRVRSVIAVPGWNITEQTNQNHLLVNETTIAILTGWKDNADLLMHDDVERLHEELRNRCRHAASAAAGQGRLRRGFQWP